MEHNQEIKVGDTDESVASPSSSDKKVRDKDEVQAVPSPSADDIKQLSASLSKIGDKDEVGPSNQVTSGKEEEKKKGDKDEAIPSTSVLMNEKNDSLSKKGEMEFN
eukprot:11100184-Ditylum_brightwellii.AAC.1